MRKYILCGRDITDRREFHRAIAAAMELPEYYGGNLDALLDVLTDLGEDTCLIITHSPELEENLGRYFSILRKVLDHAAEENSHFTYELCI